MWGRPDTADTGALHIVPGCKSLWRQRRAESAAAGLLWPVVNGILYRNYRLAVRCV